MSALDDPEELARKVCAMIHCALGLVPGAKVMVLIDHPQVADDGPAGLFSQISYDRAMELITQAKQNTETACDEGLKAIAAAMTGAKHG